MFVDKTYSFVNNKLFFGEADNLPDTFENNIYAALPIGSSVPAVIGPSGTNSNVSTIRVPWSLDNKWSGIVYDPIVVKLKQDSSWDFTAKNGIRSGAFDVEAVLMHEMGHVLGFSSHADTSSNYDKMSVLDIFRFDSAVVGTSVSGTEILASRRPILPTSGAVMSLDVNSTTYTVPMSTGVAAPGDGFQAGHWQDRTSALLGVMDPAIGSGAFPLAPIYVSAFDVRAIDLIGWDVLSGLVLNNLNLKVPAVATIVSPPDDAIGVSRAPTLVWTNPNTDPEMQIATIYVAEVSEDFDDAVFVADVSGEEVVIPAGTLSSLTTYKWAVVINSDTAWSEMAEAVFTTTSVCIADYDQNDEVDILDFLAFIEDFSACEGLPSPCGSTSDADVSGDTIVDIIDFLDFLDAFSAGCKP